MPWIRGRLHWLFLHVTVTKSNGQSNSSRSYRLIMAKKRTCLHILTWKKIDEFLKIFARVCARKNCVIRKQREVYNFTRNTFRIRNGFMLSYIWNGFTLHIFELRYQNTTNLRCCLHEPGLPDWPVFNHISLPTLKRYIKET